MTRPPNNPIFLSSDSPIVSTHIDSFSTEHLLFLMHDDAGTSSSARLNMLSHQGEDGVVLNHPVTDPAGKRPLRGDGASNGEGVALMRPKDGMFPFSLHFFFLGGYDRIYKFASLNCNFF